MNAQERERHEEARFLAQSGTPRSERSYSSLGVLGLSLQAIPGRCPLPKCVRKAGHEGECWPTP